MNCLLLTLLVIVCDEVFRATVCLTYSLFRFVSKPWRINKNNRYFHGLISTNAIDRLLPEELVFPYLITNFLTVIE